MKLNIQGKIIIIIVIILFLALGISTFVNLFHCQKNYKRALQTKVAVIGKNLRCTIEQTLALGLNLDELPGVDAKCQSIVNSYKEVYYCYIADLEMRVLYHNDPSYSNKVIKYPLDEKTWLTEEAFIRFVSFEDSKFYEISLPIIKEKEQLGEIRLGLPVEIINAEVDSIIINSILITLGSFCFAILLSVFLAQSITRPIRELRLGTEIIEKGNLDYKVKIKSKDEIGQLAIAFNKMTESLKKQNKDIINKTKQLEEAKSKDEAVLASIGDAVIACDKKGEVMLFNNMAEEITGFSIKEVIGRHYSKYLKFVIEETGKPSPDFIAKAIKSGKKTKTTDDALIIRKNGRKIPVEDSASPIKNKKGNIIGCVIVFRDVTQRRKIDKMKTEFVSLASHQLKTPLTVISWLVEMLNKGKVGKLAGKQKEYLSDVYNSTQRMIKLVNNLLNVSRLETGILRIQPEATQFEKIIQNVIKSRKALINKKQCKVIFKKPKKKLAPVLLDKSLTKQAVNNLLTNAIRYSRTGKCHVTIKLEKRAKDYLLTIADKGIGIPKDEEQYVFEKFFRADNAQKLEADGTGLGLYISKMIIESSGGKIWFQSKENKGTTFYISMPLSGMKEKKGEEILVGEKK